MKILDMFSLKGKTAVVTGGRGLQGVSSLVMGAEKTEQVKENIELINVKKISDSAREKITLAFKNVDEKVLCPWLWNK